MYLKNILLDGTGPIKFINIECQLTNNGIPKPVILVGPNGVGKSFAIANVLNALFHIHSNLYNNPVVKDGQYYKIASQGQINSNSNFLATEISFYNGILYSEICLNTIRQEFKQSYHNIPKYRIWDEMEDDKFIHANYWNNSSSKNDRNHGLKDEFDSMILQYFPPNRIEDPDWLNKKSRVEKPTYNFDTNTNEYYGRSIINHSPMADNRTWLLGLLFDRQVGEMKISVNKQYEITYKFSGIASSILDIVENYITSLLNKEGQEFTWDIGARNNKKVGFKIGNEKFFDLFSLSTGQMILLDLLISILRDGDSFYSKDKGPDQISGLVLIEDIELHLHPELQYTHLPKLLKLFPKIQFIVTTHSPQFLMGMEKQYQDNEFQIVDVENGTEIKSQYFSEVQLTFFYFVESKFFKDKLKEFSKSDKECIVFVEGITDKLYIECALKLHEKLDLLGKIEIIPANGSSKLDLLWKLGYKFFNDLLNKKCILLYDCDQEKKPEKADPLYIRSIEKIDENPLNSGIENLFDKDTIEKIEEQIDDAILHNQKVNTEIKPLPSVKLNDDRKTFICDWLCEQEKFDDFKNFSSVFKIIEDVISGDI